MSPQAETLPLIATDASTKRLSDTRAAQSINEDGELLTRGGARNTSRNAIIASVVASSALLLLCIGISLSSSSGAGAGGARVERSFALSLSEGGEEVVSAFSAAAESATRARIEHAQRERERRKPENQRQRQSGAIASHDVQAASKLGSDEDASNAAWNQPPAVVAEQGTSEDDGDEDAGTKKDEPFYQYTLLTHVLSIGIDTENDKKNSKVLREWLSHENRMDFVDLDRYLETTPGINAYDWPEKFSDAEFAVRDLELELAAAGLGDDGQPVATLGSLYYANAVAQARDNGNKLPEGWQGVGHHVGCMYAHMFQWMYAWDKHYEDTVVLESDAPWNIGVPAFSFQDIVNHQPFDYDIIFIVKPDAVTGDYLYSFNSHGPEEDKTIHMYRWNTVDQAAGLQGYIMNRRMKPKVIKHMVKTGGMDMVDAWLMTKVCSEKQPDDGKYALSCYHATTVGPADGQEVVMRNEPEVKHDASGVVRLGKYEFNRYPEDVAVPYDFGEEGSPDAPAPAAEEEEAAKEEEAQPEQEPQDEEAKEEETQPEQQEQQEEEAKEEETQPEQQEQQEEEAKEEEGAGDQPPAEEQQEETPPPTEEQQEETQSPAEEKEEETQPPAEEKQEETQPPVEEQQEETPSPTDEGGEDSKEETSEGGEPKDEAEMEDAVEAEEKEEARLEEEGGGESDSEPTPESKSKSTPDPTPEDITEGFLPVDPKLAEQGTSAGTTATRRR